MAAVSATLLFIVSFFVLSKEELLPLTQPKPRMLVDALWKIIEEFFAVESKIVTISEHFVTRNGKLQGDNLTEELLRSLPKANNLISYLLRDLNGELHINYRSYNIFVIDSFEAFQNIMTNTRHQDYDISGFFYIVYSIENPVGIYDDLLDIFALCFKVLLTNVNVLVSAHGQVQTFTYFPYSLYHCDAVVPVVYNRYENNKFIFEHPIFPTKFRNFHTCALSVATWHLPPFIKIQSGEIIGGIEGKLVLLLAELMNFKINVVTSEYGLIFKNGTVTGAFKLVIDHAADITVGSYLNTDSRNSLMCPTISYGYYDTVVAIPRGRQMSPFERLMKPFRYIIWSCLSSSLIMTFLIIGVIKLIRNDTVRNFVFGPRNELPFFNALNIFFGGCITTSPRRNFARYLLAVWLCYTFVLRNAYTSELFYLLKDTRNRITYKTLQEVSELGFKYYTSPNFQSVEEIYDVIHLYEKPLFDYLNALDDPDAKFGVLELLPYLIYYYERDVTNKVRILPERLLSAPLSIYVSRNSFLCEALNQWILKLSAAGIFRAFESMNIKNRKLPHEKIDPTPEPLSAYLLAGIFAVCFALILISIVLFFVEMLTVHCRIIRRLIDFCTYPF